MDGSAWFVQPGPERLWAAARAAAAGSPPSSLASIAALAQACRTSPVEDRFRAAHTYHSVYVRRCSPVSVLATPVGR